MAHDVSLVVSPDLSTAQTRLSDANPLPVNLVAGSVVASNPSVGANGAAIPGSSTLMGWDDGGGNLQPVSAANPLPISGTISASSSAKATTAAPSYINNTDNPLSQNLTGDLRTITKQSGVWTVGIDQSTPGATNAVDVTNFPVTVDTAAGNSSANTIRVVVASNQAAIPASQSGTWNIGTVTTITGITTAFGATAASVPANVVLNGARAATANPVAVTDGQAVGLMADKLGKLVCVGAIRTLKGSQKTTLSNTTSETTIVTAVASTFLDLYGLVLANTGATTTKVDIRDTTGGSIIATIEVPAAETRGFMLTVDSAIPQTTVNTNWTAQCASATTAMEVTALYVKNT